MDLDLLPKVKNVHWNIEVILASSKPENIMKPLVKLEFTFESSSEVPLELEFSMDNFSDFRFKTAEALKIINDINKNKVMN